MTFFGMPSFKSKVFFFKVIQMMFLISGFFLSHNWDKVFILSLNIDFSEQFCFLNYFDVLPSVKNYSPKSQWPYLKTKMLQKNDCRPEHK